MMQATTKICLVDAVSVLLAMVLAAAPAQAGSTGGSLGKSGKSVSGAAPDAAQSAKPATRSAPATTGAVMNGSWHVRQKCDTGEFEILMVLKHSSPTTFSGSAKGLTTGAATTVNGSISGSSITITRGVTLGTDHWTGRLNGSRSFSGSTQAPLWKCTYTARKQ